MVSKRSSSNAEGRPRPATSVADGDFRKTSLQKVCVASAAMLTSAMLTAIAKENNWVQHAISLALLAQRNDTCQPLFVSAGPIRPSLTRRGTPG